MTQSSKDEEYTITLDSGETLDLSGIIDTSGDITINLDDTYGTTTTYWAGDSVTDIVADGTFTITDNTVNIGNYTLSGDFGDMLIDNKIDPCKVERMCNHYPALKKVWENFNSVYEMCKQDYEGKVKAGEIDEYDDDIPF